MFYIALIVFILILSLIVIVHELGHFLVAKRNDVEVDEFGFGYPPRICGFYKSKKTGKWRFFWGKNDVYRDDINDTIYSLNLIFFGGFVKMLGEEKESSSKRSFSQKSPWVRAKIIVAGVMCNFLLAWILLTLFYFFMPKNINNEIIVVDVNNNSIAYEIGIKQNDFILKVNNDDIIDIAQLQNKIKENKGKEFQITIGRYGKEEIKTIKLPEDNSILGISMIETKQGDAELDHWYKAPYYAFLDILNTIWASLQFIGQLIASFFGAPKVSTDSVSGPVGVFSLLYQIIYLGFSYVLRFAAMISVAVGFFNILPFPALDGGHLLFILAEKIRGKKIIKTEFENAFHWLGFAALLILFVVITYNDISKLLIK